MTASSLLLRYLGTRTYALDLDIGVGQKIRHAFHPGDTLDITSIASPSELNRCLPYIALRDAGLFTEVFTLGSTDISQVADVGGQVLSTHTPAALGPAATAGSGSQASKDDHIHALPYGLVGSLAGLSVGGSAAAGSSSSVARVDHAHTVTIPAATITSTMEGIAESAGQSPLIVLTNTFSAGGGGSPDDVTIFSANAPYTFQIVDSWFYCTTAVGGSTVTLRSATGGGGSAKSDAFNTATTGIKRNTALAALPSSTAANGTLVIRRSDNGVAGNMVLLIQKV